jgi:hypothetical protein
MSQVPSSDPHIEVREQPQLSNVPYILGHSNAELRRLMLQSAILKPITQRLLLESAGEYAALHSDGHHTAGRGG